MLISCVLTECVTQRSSGLLVTKLCQVSPSLNVANVHLVLLGTQAVGEGAQLPGGQLAHFWGQIHEGHIPTGTSVSAATQNTLFQMDDLWHQQHNKIPGGLKVSSSSFFVLPQLFSGLCLMSLSWFSLSSLFQLPHTWVTFSELSILRLVF